MQSMFLLFWIFFPSIDINSSLSLYTLFEILAEGNLMSFFDSVFFLSIIFYYMNDILMPHMLQWLEIFHRIFPK